jgi:hypothetical protein
MNNFQRGGDIKRTVGVGQAAIAPEVKVLYQLNPDMMEINADTGKLEPHKWRIGSLQIAIILKDIEEGNERAMNPRFLGFLDKDDNFKRLHKVEGGYVQYNGITYRIKPNEDRN